jgi:RNA polymerase sigma-70 factor (ECF subfamily)
LNRAIAIAERDGPEAGLAALRAIEDSERLAAYPFYPAAFGELELRREDRAAATDHFRAALAVARSEPERRFLNLRIAAALTGGNVTVGTVEKSMRNARSAGPLWRNGQRRPDPSRR